MSSATLYSVSYDLVHAILAAIGSVLPYPGNVWITNPDLITGLAVLVFAAILLIAPMLSTIVLIWWER